MWLLLSALACIHPCSKWKKEKNKALPCKHAQLCSPASPNIWIFLVERESLGSWSVWLWHRMGRALCPSPPPLCRELAPGKCWRQLLHRLGGFFYFFPWWCLGLKPWRKHILPPLLPHPPLPGLVHNSWGLSITPSVTTMGKSRISHMCKLLFCLPRMLFNKFSSS